MRRRKEGEEGCGGVITGEYLRNNEEGKGWWSNLYSQYYRIDGTGEKNQSDVVGGRRKEENKSLIWGFLA